MKLRESSQKYYVRKHGTEYVDYSGPVMICPECQGTNVREIVNKKSGCGGNYLCKDCGCKFDTWIDKDLTKAGAIVSKVLAALCVVFVMLGGLSLLGGIIYAGNLRSIYPNGSCPDNLKVKVILISTLGPLICGIAAAIATKIHEKI